MTPGRLAAALTLATVALATAAQAQAPPPADRDGDGRPDTEDRCPKAFGTPQNGCPTATTTISIFYSNKTHKFSGRIVAGARPCIQRRTVTLEKYKGKGRVVVASARTDARGVWRIRRGRSRGSYVVRLPAELIPDLANCEAALSDRLRQG